MNPTRFCTVLLAALVSLCLSMAGAQPVPNAPMANDFIHSDLPLFGGATTEKWPRAFQAGEDFGCESRVAFGDWELRETDGESDAEWFSVTNYGVFHCWANVRRADRREDLAGVESRPAFFVLLGTTEAENRDIELWALQLGARPGSDYLLLSRPIEAGRIATFRVLQTACPRGSARDGHALGILMTRYCAINTQAELLRLARRMAQHPARGTLTLVEPDGDEASRE